jgi:hypothetical protein
MEYDYCDRKARIFARKGDGIATCSWSRRSRLVEDPPRHAAKDGQLVVPDRDLNTKYDTFFPRLTYYGVAGQIKGCMESIILWSQ